MAGSELTSERELSVIGWRWAPPPPPDPSPLRGQEPQWTEPLALPAPPPASNGKGTAVALFGGGLFCLMLAGASAAWAIIALGLFVAGVLVAKNSSDSPASSASVVNTRAQLWRQYEQSHQAWREAIERDEGAAKSKYDSAPRWYPIGRRDPRRRLDVFGGVVEGWASLMHTAFVPLIRSGTAVTVLDLTRRDLARRALWADAINAGPLVVALPAQLDEFDPLVGARNPGALAAALITAGGGDEDRARLDPLEAGILRRIASTLDRPVSLMRLLAAVTALLAPRHPRVDAHLNKSEKARLQAPDFVAMMGSDAPKALSRIAVALESVTPESVQEEPAAAPRLLPYFDHDAVVVTVGPPTTDTEDRRRFDSLLVQALVDTLLQRATVDGLLLVVGADRVSWRTLDELTTAAADRGLRLVLFFEHLEGERRTHLGRSAAETLIMGLGNHEDARAAADFIGKQHRFVISSITRTVGDQLGGSDTHSFSVNDSTSYSHTRTAGPDSYTEGSGRTIGASFSYAETWSKTNTYGETATRSEELVARVEDIQRIPATGFVYVPSSQGAGQHVVFGDCHPAIARSPLVAQRAITR